MTPSAPRSKALMMKSGLIRLLHGARMIRTFGDILRRLVPARSAPVYVHQLQTKATTFGSNAAPGAGASVGEGVGMGTPAASPGAAGTARRQRGSGAAPPLARGDRSNCDLTGAIRQHRACQAR